MADVPPPLAGPSVVEIFIGFFMIGVHVFGGVLPWARRTIIEECDRPWRRAIQKGLLPVTTGLLISSAALLIKATTLDWSLGLLTLVVTVLLLTTRLNPMILLGGAAALGAIGLVG